MKSVARNRGIIAPTLLLIALSAGAGFLQGTKNGRYQQPGKSILPDPAAQRREMITSLKAMQLNLATIEKSMASLERIAGAQLRLQFDEQKKQTAEKAKQKSK
ncbi:MAG: hypothetical protein COA70_01415 [Planctomycetota bacterium]|nr:MAG: hypothetical protein COA70_01415 [Planctomycetota bacterium]